MTKKKTTKKFDSLPPSWARVMYPWEKPKPKTKIPKGEKHTGFDSPYTINTEQDIKIDIEKYTKMWIEREIKIMLDMLYKGETIATYETLKELQEQLQIKGKILTISRDYEKNTETNQIKKLTVVSCGVHWKKLEEFKAKEQEKAIAKKLKKEMKLDKQ